MVELKNEAENTWSPDNFLAEQLGYYLKIFTSSERHDCFQLSSGVNSFPMPRIWKDLLKIEIEYDLAYQWYTFPQGFPTLQRVVKVWENFVASEGNLKKLPWVGSTCMTIGASQAVTAVFDYVSSCSGKATVLLVGLNYSLFERLARMYHFSILEAINRDVHSTSTLPPADEVTHILLNKKPELVVIVTPNNPSGENYCEADLVKILCAASRSGTLVLLDRVGELPVPLDKWTNVGKAVLEAQAQAQVVSINSFSKTDSIPGFRIGYIFGSSDVVEHAAKLQSRFASNPQTIPVLPVVFSLLARCVFIGERMGWSCPGDRSYILQLFLHLFDVTTAVAPSSILEIIANRLTESLFEIDYNNYVTEQLSNQNSMTNNYLYTLNTLSPYISRHTKLEGGFNFLVELEPFKYRDEDKVCKDIFQSTRLPLLTESCFIINRRKNSENFWIRITTAAPDSKFKLAIDRLKLFFDQKQKF